MNKMKRIEELKVLIFNNSITRDINEHERKSLWSELLELQKDSYDNKVKLFEKWFNIRKEEVFWDWEWEDTRLEVFIPFNKFVIPKREDPIKIILRFMHSAYVFSKTKIDSIIKIDGFQEMYVHGNEPKNAGLEDENEMNYMYSIDFVFYLPIQYYEEYIEYGKEH